jgi:hypothetical protein
MHRLIITLTTHNLSDPKCTRFMGSQSLTPHNLSDPKLYSLCGQPEARDAHELEPNYLYTVELTGAKAMLKGCADIAATMEERADNQTK